MIDENLLNWLRCPIDGQRLMLADGSLIDELNRRIGLRTLRDQGDQVVDQPLQAALVTGDRQRVYPVRDDIPTLIPAESIPLAQELR